MDPTKSNSWWNPQPPPPPSSNFSERTSPDGGGMFGLPHLSGGFLPNNNSTISSGLQRRRSSVFMNEFPPSTSTFTISHPPGVHHHQSMNDNKQSDFGRYPPSSNFGSVSFGVHNNNHPNQLAPTTTIGLDFNRTIQNRGERQQQQQQLLMNHRHSGMFLSSMSPLMMELSTIHNMRQTQQQQPQSEHRNHEMPDRMPIFSLNNASLPPGTNMSSHSTPHLSVVPFGPLFPFPTPELLRLQQHSGSSQTRESSSPVSTSPSRASGAAPDTSLGLTNGLYLSHQGVQVSPLQVTRKTPSGVDGNHPNPIPSSSSSTAASLTLPKSKGGVPPVASGSTVPVGKGSIALAMLRNRSRSSSASVLDLTETSDGSRSASLSSTPTGELFGGHRRVSSSTSSTDLESSPGPRMNSNNNKRTRTFRRNLETQMIQESPGTEDDQGDGGSASGDGGDHDSNVEEKDFERSEMAGPKKKGNKSPRVSDELRKRPLPDSPSLPSSTQPPLPSTSSTTTATTGLQLPVVAPSASLQRSSSMQSITVSDDGMYAGQQSGLGGERRLNIRFETYGVIRPGKKQTFGKSGWGIPDGLAGQHTMYAQQWRFEVVHGEVLGTVVITFKVKNRSPISNTFSEKEIVVTESPDQAALRQARGNTICNIVLRKALDARAAELEALIKEGGKSPVQIAHLKSLIRELNPKQCTEGLLFFGLRHETVQLRALESPVAATANGDDQRMETSVGGNQIKRSNSASY